MKHAFRPALTALESRLVLSTVSASAHQVAAKAAASTPAAVAVVPATVATSLTTHLYQDTLGRSPDVVGMATFVPALQAGITTAQMTDMLVTSPEYIAKNITAGASALTAQTQYVTALYNTVLGRTPDPASLKAWVGAIASNTLSLSQVAGAIVNSTEAATSPTSILVKDSFPVIATNAMTNLYQSTLGRNPDAVALATDLPALEAGVTTAQMTDMIVTSPEYVGKHTTVGATSSVNEAQYVGSLYTTVLGRAAEPGAVAYWVNAIDTHALTLGQVAATIVNSTEAATSATSVLVRDAV